MAEKERRTRFVDRARLFEEEFPSDAEIGEVVMDKLMELGDSRDEAEAKLVKWNREHGI